MIMRKIEVQNPTGRIINCGRKTFPPHSYTLFMVEDTAYHEIDAHCDLKVAVVAVACPFCGKLTSAKSKKGLAVHISQMHPEVNYNDNPILQQRK